MITDDACDWFCICAKGDLYLLGNHGDFEAASDTAESLHLDPIWIFDETTAIEWRAKLDRFLGDDGYEFKYSEPT